MNDSNIRQARVKKILCGILNLPTGGKWKIYLLISYVVMK